MIKQLLTIRTIEEDKELEAPECPYCFLNRRGVSCGEYPCTWREGEYISFYIYKEDLNETHKS